MRRVTKLAITTIVVLAASTPAAMASRICDDLWFTRNAIVDQAGYCFGSTLGRAQFDNTGCTGQQITLTPVQTASVTEIQRLERTFGCSVNTGRTTLDMPDLALRKRLTVQPIPHEDLQGWGCLGYVGPQVLLHAAPNAASAQVGHIGTGVWISVGGHKDVNGWIYVTTHAPSWGTFRSGGWMLMGPTLSCEAEAG